MNNDNSNRVKQINRVAAPIRLDNNGNPIKNEESMQMLDKNINEMNRIAPTPVAVQENIQDTLVEVKNEEKEHDNTNMIFAVIFLIIFAFLVAFIVYFIIPRLNSSSEREIIYNDKTTTTTSEADNIVNIIPINLSSDSFITGDFEKDVTDFFKVKTVSTNGVLNIYVNDINITSAYALFSNAAYVDDLLFLGVKNQNERTTKLLIIDVDGNIVKEYYNLGTGDGLAIMSDSTSIIFNQESIILITSRIYENKIIMSNEFGSLEGLDVCDEDVMNENKIGDSTLAMSYFSFSYLGKHKFSEPKSINNITLSKYIEDNKLCK